MGRERRRNAACVLPEGVGASALSLVEGLRPLPGGDAAPLPGYEVRGAGVGLMGSIAAAR